MVNNCHAFLLSSPFSIFATSLVLTTDHCVSPECSVLTQSLEEEPQVSGERKGGGGREEEERSSRKWVE